MVFIILGLFGGWAFVYPSGGDLLSVLNSNSDGGPEWLGDLSQISVYLYPLVALLTGIPVFSIVIRYNLLENKLCSKGVCPAAAPTAASVSDPHVQPRPISSLLFFHGRSQLW